MEIFEDVRQQHAQTHRMTMTIAAVIVVVVAAIEVRRRDDATVSLDEACHGGIREGERFVVIVVRRASRSRLLYEIVKQLLALAVEKSGSRLVRKSFLILKDQAEVIFSFLGLSRTLSLK